MAEEKYTVLDIRGIEHHLVKSDIKGVEPGKIWLTNGAFIHIDESPILAQAISITVGLDENLTLDNLLVIDHQPAKKDNA